MRGNRRRTVFQAKTMLPLQGLRNGIAMMCVLAESRWDTADRMGVLARAVMVVMRVVVVVMVALGAII